MCSLPIPSLVAPALKTMYKAKGKQNICKMLQFKVLPCPKVTIIRLNGLNAINLSSVKTVANQLKKNGFLLLWSLIIS